jgi:VanZ family protein
MVKFASRLFYAWLPVVLWYGIIYLLSDQPKLPGPEDSFWSFVWFKTAHLMVYGILSMLNYRAWSILLPNSGQRQRLILAFLSSVVFASHDEWHQSFIAGRTGTIRDVGIDALGTSVTLWLQRRYNLLRYPKSGIQRT